MKEKIINFVKIAFCLLVFFKVSTLLMNIFKILGFNFNNFNNADVAYFNGLIDSIDLIVILLLYKIVLKNDFAKIKNNTKDFRDNLVKYICLFLAIKIASAVISAIISVIFNIDIGVVDNQNSIELAFKEAPFVMFLCVSVFAPLVEESIFRLGFKKVLTNKYVFILISGCVFGFMHIFPTDLALSVALLQSVTYVSMGMFLAYVYQKTDNIWLTIFIHFANNFLSVLFLIL